MKIEDESKQIKKPKNDKWCRLIKYILDLLFKIVIKTTFLMS